MKSLLFEFLKREVKDPPVKGVTIFSYSSVLSTVMNELLSIVPGRHLLSSYEPNLGAYPPENKVHSTM